MSDFVIIEPEYPRLLELLLEEAPSFGESEEVARLEPNERALPSVVGGAFKRYVERLYAQADVGTPGSEERLAETHRAIERLARSRDLDVVNTLVVDDSDLLPAEATRALRTRLRSRGNAASGSPAGL